VVVSVQDGSFPAVGTVGLLLYFLLVSHVEEDIFRGILPQLMGNIWVPQVLYALFHVFVISGLVGSFDLGLMFPLLLFTFGFGVAMMLLTQSFKSTVPSKAVHWVFD